MNYDLRLQSFKGFKTLAVRRLINDSREAEKVGKFSFNSGIHCPF
tara:strand:+ start:17540 stop:17674 length:135 start_codon:yes stop_codon:yes gene_type:complete